MGIAGWLRRRAFLLSTGKLNAERAARDFHCFHSFSLGSPRPLHPARSCRNHRGRNSDQSAPSPRWLGFPRAAGSTRRPQSQGLSSVSLRMLGTCSCSDTCNTSCAVPCRRLGAGEASRTGSKSAPLCAHIGNSRNWRSGSAASAPGWRGCGCHGSDSRRRRSPGHARYASP